MLNIFRLVILSLLLLVLNVGQTAENNLTLFKNPVCSSSGTVVLFLNGIENKKVDAINSTDEIKKIVGINPYPKNGVPALFDENSIDVQYIYNRTVDKQNDVNEIAIQKIKEHAGFKSEKWAVLKTALMDETITPQLLEEYEVLKKQLPLSFLYFDSLIALKKDHDSNLLMKEILERYEEDLKDLSGKVQGYLKNKKKVVIVSHSQGNLFANDIYQKLVQEATTTEEQDLINTYLANLQVAGFGEQTYIPKSAIIKLDLDKAVNKMGYPSNMRMVFGNSGINHNFISTYLSPVATAIGNNAVSSFDKQTSMRVIFGNTLLNLTRNIPSNCCRKSESTEDHPNRDDNGKLQNGVAWVASTASTTSIKIGKLTGNIEVCDNATFISDSVSGFAVNLRLVGKSLIKANNLYFSNLPSDYSGARRDIISTLDLGDLYMSAPLTLLKDDARVKGRHFQFDNQSISGQKIVLSENALVSSCYSVFHIDSRVPHSLLIGGNSLVSNFTFFFNSTTSGGTNMIIPLQDIDCSYEIPEGGGVPIRASVTNSVLLGDNSIIKSSLLNATLEGSNVTDSYVFDITLKNSSMNCSTIAGSSRMFSSLNLGFTNCSYSEATFKLECSDYFECNSSH